MPLQYRMRSLSLQHDRHRTSFSATTLPFSFAPPTLPSCFCLGFAHVLLHCFVSLLRHDRAFHRHSPSFLRLLVFPFQRRCTARRHHLLPSLRVRLPTSFVFPRALALPPRRKVSIHVGRDLDCDGTRSRWECTDASRRGAPSSSSITSSSITSSSFLRASHVAPWRCQGPSVAAESVPRSCGRGGARAKLAARILAKATADVGRKVVVAARKTWWKEAPRASHLLDVDVDVQRMRRKVQATQVVSWRA